MKKFIVAGLIMISCLCIFVSCTKRNIISESQAEIFEKIGLDDEYKDAYFNCIFYLENSPNANRNIDTSVVSVELLKEKQKELVHIINSEDENDFKSTETKYWLFQIGDTKAHDFILLVCDSRSNNVIGTIPIK